MPEMQVTDLTKRFKQFRNSEIELEEYHRGAPHVFEHYDTFWGNSRVSGATQHQIDLGRRLILSNLSHVEEQFNRFGYPTDRLELVLLIGNGSANGHAVLDANGEPTVWLAVECFQNSLEAKVFLTHEIIHALHYQRQPEFTFRTMEDKHCVWRQLITEGIATYLTKKIFKVPDEIALWADALPPDELYSWMNTCRNRERELFEYIDRNFNSSDPSISLFNAADPNDIFAFRAGYYAGLKLTEAFCTKENIKDRDLPTIPVDRLCNSIQRLLRNWNFVDNFQTERSRISYF